MPLRPRSAGDTRCPIAAGCLGICSPRGQRRSKAFTVYLLSTKCSPSQGVPIPTSRERKLRLRHDVNLSGATEGVSGRSRFPAHGLLIQITLFDRCTVTRGRAYSGIISIYQALTWEFSPRAQGWILSPVGIALSGCSEDGEFSKTRRRLTFMQTSHSDGVFPGPPKIGLRLEIGLMSRSKQPSTSLYDHLHILLSLLWRKKTTEYQV